MKQEKILIYAADGNGTAIEILQQPLTREQYALRGQQLQQAMADDTVEQAGFLIMPARHFEMAGGEFCGNASRAAALLLAEESSKNEVLFTISGFHGTVQAKVNKLSDRIYDVSCRFPGMPITVSSITLNANQQGYLVDLGGIVHIVIEDNFPADPADYQRIHQKLTQTFNLTEREAVGVLWFERIQDKIKMYPVIWVKAVDSMFYEQSCGSGSIAVSKVTGISHIEQPTGKTITVTINLDEVILQSEMTIVSR